MVVKPLFEKVFGHQHVKTIFENMIKSEKLHHGLCFHGPNGIGKRLLAEEISKVMLCEQMTGCDTCNHCRKFDSGNHPDYALIEPDGNDIKVDQIRAISENLHFRPFEAKVRMIIIDQAERMGESAANAFLKSLEEPPEYVYFILVSGDVKALLPTIRSRCQQMAFQSLTEQDKGKILVTRFNKSEEMAARLAGISFRKLETENEAWDLFLNDTQKALTYYKLMLDVGHAIDYFKDQLRDKNVLPRFSDHLIAVTRELTLMAAGLPGSSAFEGLRDKISELAARAPSSAWRKTWEEITQLQGRRRLHLNQALWFNAMSVTGLGLLEDAERQLKRRLEKRA